MYLLSRTLKENLWLERRCLKEVLEHPMYLRVHVLSAVSAGDFVADVAAANIGVF